MPIQLDSMQITSSARHAGRNAAVLASFLWLSSSLTAAPPHRLGAAASPPAAPIRVTFETRLADERPWRPGDPVRQEDRRLDHGREVNLPDIAPQRDALLGFQSRALAFDLPPGFGPLSIDVPGIGFAGAFPPDACGDVGVHYYVQMVNDFHGCRFAIHRKSDGVRVAGPTRLDDLGGDAGRGDPYVMFDHLAARWVMSQIVSDGNAHRLSVYLSETIDPTTGDWVRYDFDTEDFPDYPKLGVWPDAYYLTTNESDGPAVYALDRAAMLAGQPATSQRFVGPVLSGFGFQALTPCDLDGPAPAASAPGIVMRHRDDELHDPTTSDATRDFIELFEVAIDWSDATASSFTGPFAIPTAEFDSTLCGASSFACFAQRGSSVRLDPLREVVMSRAQYRRHDAHEAIVGSFVTDVDGTDRGGVRWFELRRAEGAPWVLHQEGTYAPDDDNRFMSSIAADVHGNVMLLHAVASDDEYPSLRYAGRRASDAMGALPHGEHVFAPGSSPSGSNRHGDYSSLSVDPVDGETFWLTGQYHPAEQWATRIGAVRFTTAVPRTGAVDSDEALVDVMVCGCDQMSDASCAELHDALDVRATSLLDGVATEVWRMPAGQHDEIERAFAAHGIRSGVTTRVLDGALDSLTWPVDGRPVRAPQQVLLDALQHAPDAGAISVFRAPPRDVMLFQLTRGFGTRHDEGVMPAIRMSIDAAATTAAFRRTALRGSERGFVWSGIDIERDGQITMLVEGDRIAGTMHLDGVVYAIRALGDGVHAIVPRPRVAGEEHPPRFFERAARQAERDARRDRPPPADPAVTESWTVDVLVLYTESAVAAYPAPPGSGVSDEAVFLQDVVRLAIEETNQSLRDSGVNNVEVRLAGAELTDYMEGAPWTAHLDALVDPDDDVMDEVHERRDELGADIVVLIVNDSAYCGEAAAIGATAATAFAVVHHDCATGYYSFGHEIGHLFGARHDRHVDPTDVPFPYGHGHFHETTWRTIMAYGAGCASCIRRPYWSSPDIAIDGTTAGHAETAHNARVLRQQAKTVAAFRDPP